MRDSTIYSYTPVYSPVTPFAQDGYTVRELTAAAHVFHVGRDGNNRWVASKGSLRTRPHRTRASACLLMSQMLDGITID